MRTVRSLHRLTVSISVVRLVLSLSPLSRRVADVRTTMLYGLRKSRGVMYTLINTLDREPRLVLLRTTATSDSRSRRCALWLVCRDSRSCRCVLVCASVGASVGPRPWAVGCALCTASSPHAQQRAKHDFTTKTRGGEKSTHGTAHTHNFTRARRSKSKLSVDRKEKLA